MVISALTLGLCIGLGTIVGAAITAGIILFTKADKRKQQKYEKKYEEAMDPDIIPDIVMCSASAQNHEPSSEFTEKIREEEELYREALRDADNHKISRTERNSFIDNFVKSNKRKYGDDWKKKNIYASVIYDYMINDYSIITKYDGKYRIFFNSAKAAEHNDVGSKTLHANDDYLLFNASKDFEYSKFVDEYIVPLSELRKRYSPKKEKESA